MKLTKENSEVIGMLRFPMVMGIVMVHASFPATIFSPDTQPGPTYGIVQILISDVFARLGVPFFFMFSAFLLFQGKPLSVKLVKEKWISRFYTLLIPYLLWNTIALAIRLVAQILPSTSEHIASGKWDVKNMSARTLLDAYVGFDIGPVTFQLWFIRDLIILVFFAPFLYWALRKLGRYAWVLPAFMLAAWWEFLVNFDLFPLITERAVFFFTMGLYISMHDTEHIEAFVRKKSSAIGFGLVYLAWAGVEVYLTYNNLPVFVWHQIGVVLGVHALFSAVHVWVRGSWLQGPLLYVSPAAYLVFLGHGLLMPVYFRALVKIIGPTSDAGFIGLYFSLGLSLIITFGTAYFVMRRYCPIMLTILMGKSAVKSKGKAGAAAVVAPV